MDMQSQIEVDEEDLYTLKITCKGKEQQGRQRNKGRKNIIGLKNQKYKKEKGNTRGKKRKKKEKRKTPQNCKSPMQRQRFITTIKLVTEYSKKHIHP